MPHPDRRPRRLGVLALAAIPALLAAPGPGAAQVSGEGAPFLLLPTGARAVALGRAVTAMPGPESAFWNPAGLATVTGRRVLVLRSDHAVGPATAFSALQHLRGIGTLALSYQLLDVGDLELTDEQNNVTGTVSVRNHLAVLTGATQIFDRLSAGVNLKLVRFQLSCRGFCNDVGSTATTYAVDAGLQMAPTREVPLRLGLMVAHGGPALQVFNAEQADPLPSRFRLAVAYDVVSELVDQPGLSGWLTVEAQSRVREPGGPAIYVGSEIEAGSDDALVLRAGYVVNDADQNEGARVGLGFRYQKFELALAKSLAVSTVYGDTEPIHVTFGVAF